MPDDTSNSATSVASLEQPHSLDGMLTGRCSPSGQLFAARAGFMSSGASDGSVGGRQSVGGVKGGTEGGVYIPSGLDALLGPTTALPIAKHDEESGDNARGGAAVHVCVPPRVHGSGGVLRDEMPLALIKGEVPAADPTLATGKASSQGPGRGRAALERDLQLALWVENGWRRV